MKKTKLVKPVKQIVCACCKRKVTQIINESINVDKHRDNVEFSVLYQKVTGHLVCGRCVGTHNFIQKQAGGVLIYNPLKDKYYADVNKINKVVDLDLVLEENAITFNEAFSDSKTKVMEVMKNMPVAVPK